MEGLLSTGPTPSSLDGMSTTRPPQGPCAGELPGRCAGCEGNKKVEFILEMFQTHKIFLFSFMA